MKTKIKSLMYGIFTGVVLFVMVQVIGCGGNSENQNEEKADIVKVNNQEKEEHSCCSSDMDDDEEEFSDESIYQLESEWTNQSGKEVELEEFKGKPVVFTMFFASCNYACPILVYDMKKIESKLSPEELKDYQFVLVSIDPERDTPQALNEYAKKFNLDTNRWSLLTGDKDDVLELAAVLGFKYKQEEDGQFSHSNLINIINEKGEVVFQHVGLNKDISLAAEKLTELNRF